MTTRGMIIKWSDDEIEFGEWTQENNLETFVAETEFGTLRVPIDPSTEYYDDETGRTYFEATGKEYKTVVLFQVLECEKNFRFHWYYYWKVEGDWENKRER